MYVDDRGASKCLPINTRATNFAQACGLNTVIRGDAFVSRARESNDEYERLDFTLTDLSSDAPWVVQAAEWNLSKRDIKQNVEDLQKDSSLCRRSGCSNVGTHRCSRCREAKYCSRECQKSAWGQHKQNCNPKVNE
jgi:hypothetical protein